MVAHVVVPASVAADAPITHIDAELIITAESPGDVMDILRAVPAYAASEILLDMGFYIADFCRTQSFTPEKTAVVFYIMMQTHTFATSTPHENFQPSAELFTKFLHTHMVQRPPYSEAVFSLPDGQAIMDFAFTTYFRHFQLYKYVFTPEPVVALHFNIPKPPEVAVPAEDPPAAAVDAESEGEAAEATDAAEAEQADEAALAATAAKSEDPPAPADGGEEPAEVDEHEQALNNFQESLLKTLGADDLAEALQNKLDGLTL